MTTETSVIEMINAFSVHPDGAPMTIKIPMPPEMKFKECIGRHFHPDFKDEDSNASTALHAFQEWFAWYQAQQAAINTIPAGWLMTAADFSCIAAGLGKPGYVMLVRDAAGKTAWHKMPDAAKEADDGPELYVSGSGTTFDEAMKNAITAARNATPIPQ